MLPAQPLPGLLVGGLIGLAVAYAARIPHTSARAILPIYILFPFQSPELAALTGICATLVAMTRRTTLQNRRIELLVVVLALVLYGLTLAPGTQPADSGEFQLVIAEWGVAHPPGYPLYTVLAGVFARLVPLHDIAWRANLFSAVIAALTLGVMAGTLRRISGSGWAGLIAAGVLGSTTAFWTTATQASIRPMTTLFMTLMAAAALSYKRAVDQDNPSGQWRALLGFALAAGFGVTHHASLLFPGSIVALAMVIARPGLVLEPRKWATAILAALTGALPWLYLLIRGAADARLAPPSLTTWDGFWQHVLASGFAGDMFYYRTLPEIGERLRLIGEVLRFQWYPGMPVLAGAAALVVLFKYRWAAVTFGGAFAVHTLITATYRAPQTVEYMLPAYVCIAVLIGLGVGALLTWDGKGRNIVGSAVAALACIAVVWSAWPSWISLGAYQHHDSTHQHALETLESAPADSIILANWHHVTPLWVVQSQLGLRPDVHPQYVAPAGSEPILETWARLISERASSPEPVVTCSYYPETFRFTDLTFSSSGSCWQAAAELVPESQGQPLATFGGHDLLTYTVPDQVAAGAELTVHLSWRLEQTSPYGDLTAFSHLVDETDTVVAQVDRPFVTASNREDTSLQQQHVIHVPPTVLPGEYRLVTGLYRQGPDGPQLILDTTGSPRHEIARVIVTPRTLTPVTAHPSHTPLSSQLMLAGYDVDLSVLGRARLYLHWRITPTTEANPVWQITINGPSGPLAEREFAAHGMPGYLTTAFDIPDTEAARGLDIIVTEDGRPLVVRGAWHLPVQPAIYLPPIAPNQHYIMVGDVIITDYAVHHRDDVQGSTTVQLTMQSTVPQTRDITLKVATDTTSTEGIPVGGMIPSLKWYWSASFRDTTVLTPTDAEPRQAAITLYDSFTSETWPVFDPVLGQTSPVLILPVTP